MYKILGNYDIIGKHLGVLQQALGVVQTLKSPERAEFQLLMNLERQVQENLAASRDSTSVVNQVKTKISKNSTQLFLIHTLCQLFLVHTYPLSLFSFCESIISLLAAFYFLTSHIRRYRCKYKKILAMQVRQT